MANGRIKEIIDIYEDEFKYEKISKIFTTTPNVIIEEKMTYFKQTGTRTNEITRFVNGVMQKRNIHTVVRDN